MPGYFGLFDEGAAVSLCGALKGQPWMDRRSTSLEWAGRDFDQAGRTQFAETPL
jgi:hypothetical protein